MMLLFLHVGLKKCGNFAMFLPVINLKCIFKKQHSVGLVSIAMQATLFDKNLISRMTKRLEKLGDKKAKNLQ